MTKNFLYDDIDNCLTCRYSKITPNSVAEMFRKWGLVGVADKLAMFPVVTCKLSDNRYVANPMKRPGWCKVHGPNK